jgi:hypothetical protein
MMNGSKKIKLAALGKFGTGRTNRLGYSWQSVDELYRRRREYRLFLSDKLLRTYTVEIEVVKKRITSKVCELGC